MKEIKVVELFAGVGGFRIALDKAGKKSQVKFNTVWASQWEPSTSKQHAAEIYEARFGPKGLSVVDIEKVISDDFKSIPDHNLIVGGFPCQDYSVAKTLSRSHGLVGKKGVLWWSIHAILEKKGKNSPDYIFLENVDRLLKSPSVQRGRDFAVMLASLSDLGYAVEWRVVNAADYGFPQRRRRVFILGFKKSTALYKSLHKTKNKFDWLTETGVLADAFSVEKATTKNNTFEIEGDLATVTDKFSVGRPKLSPFENSGLMINRIVHTTKTSPKFKGKKSVLGDFIIDENDVPAEYFIDKKQLKSWEYLKGGKREPRKSKSGHEYFYTEGPMTFPDKLDAPSRTIITGEGGVSPSRFKHVIKTPSGKYRRLTPLELERLNMFPDNHTKLVGVPDTKRAFIMGNALVVGAIQKVGESLAKKIN